MSASENLAEILQHRYIKNCMQVETVAALEVAMKDEVSENADQRLKQFGGLALLLDRMSPQGNRLWKSSDISLDASVIPSNYGDSYVILSATRQTPTGRLGKLGVYTVVGRRVRGNPFWVKPNIDSSTDLAYTASAIAARRERLGKLPQLLS